MKNLFDEFMEELRRRQEAEAAAARGERPDEAASATPGEEAGDGEERAEEGGPEAPEEAPEQPAATGAGEVHEAEEPEPEPVPLGRPAGGGRGGRGGRASGRPPGGPNDGGTFGSRAAMVGRRLGLAVVIIAVLALFTLGGFGLDLWTDAIWFKSVGFDAVFWTRIGTQALLLVGGLGIALVFLLGNIWLARRLLPPPEPNGGTLRGLFDRLGEAARNADRSGAWSGPRPGDEERIFGPWGPRGGPARRGGSPVGPRPVILEAGDLPDLAPMAVWIIVAVAVILAIGIGAAASGSWETILLFQHRVPFAPSGPAVTDPVFGRDISFFLFDLPFLRLIQSLANGLLLGAIVVSVGSYLVGAMRGSLVFSTPVRVHLAVLVGLYLLSVAAGYQLDKFELVYSSRGVATGVSFTDANAQFLALDVLTAIAALSAAFLVGGAFTRMIWPLGLAVGVWFVASIVLGQVYPAFVQRFTVEPNQFAQEQPYINNNIAMTRLAYALNGWQLHDYGGEAQLLPSAATEDRSTFDNARIWDYRPLGDTIDQIQTVRQYYTFTDVDTDRYQIGGAEHQVMLSARELAPEKNPQANSWVNQKLTFTHGVGAVMVPVNEATEGGQPVFLIKDLPPVASGGAPAIKQSGIYFGERPSDYVVVGARQAEFDYPIGGSQSANDTTNAATTTWTGTTGIRIDSTLTRLLFAARFRDLNLLISDQITNQSQLLFHRTLSERLAMIAPFLSFDKDPYLVVTNEGRLVYVQDAYTMSDRFPNAQYFDPTTLPGTTGLGDQPFNYLRNSVKIVMDAYDGSMTFYVADPSDPIVRAYEGVFPTLFAPMSKMPADLVPHLRVPEELFNVQTRMFATYHVTSPSTFYNKEDLWTIPTATGSDQSLPPEAYYIFMRMPDQAQNEFLLLQPMVPQKRPNMIAWVAARNDAPNYGSVVVYKFAQNTSVLGPNQIEAKIDADPTISSQISLWNQSGSKVIRGNLIVMPIQDSLLYLQPVYLQSTSSQFPLLQKVVLATSNNVVWGNTLGDALQSLLTAEAANPGPGSSAQPGPTPTPGPVQTPAPSGAPGATPPAGNVQALVSYANTHFELAQQALRNGDFATYGSEMRLVQEALRQLAITTGASPAP